MDGWMDRLKVWMDVQYERMDEYMKRWMDE